MNKIVRHGFSSIIFMIIGAALGFLNGILLFPKLIGEEIYGFTQWAISFTAIFLLIGNIGLDKIIIGFYPKIKDAKEKNDLFGAILFWVISGAGISILVLFLLKSTFLSFIHSDVTRNLVEEYFYVLFIYIFLQAILAYFVSLSDVAQRPRVNVFISEVIQRLVTTCLILLYYFDIITDHQFVIAYLLKTVLSIIILVWFIKYEVQLRITINFSRLFKTINKSMWKFGLFTGFSRLGGQLVTTLDIIMLGVLISVDEVGYYFPLVMVSKVIMLPHLGMAKIVNPIIAEKWANNDVPGIKKIFRDSALSNTVLSLLLCIGIMANTDLLFYLLPDQWEQGYFALIIICFARLIHVINGYNGIVLLYSEKYHYDIYLKVLLLILTVITNLLFIPQYQLTGAAMATLITLMVFNIIVSIINWKHFKIHPFQWSYFRLFFIAMVAYVVGSLTDYIFNNIYLEAFFKSVLISLIFLWMVYIFKISSSFNSKLQVAFNNLKERIT